MIRLALVFALAAAPAAAATPDLALPFLALGFAAGLAHALDADHVAAVAALMDGGDSRRKIALRGAAWGLGHTAALFVICSAVLLLGLAISETVGAALELAVGLMIAALGLRVLRRLRAERVHIHVHDHGGTRHVHAHSHKGEAAPHAESGHDHRHATGALLPSFAVGLVHGAAGSAGLLVLALAGAGGTGEALLAFALFGLGSVIGMTCLTAAASWPLGLVHRAGGAARSALALAIGGLALFVGGGVALGSLGALI